MAAPSPPNGRRSETSRLDAPADEDAAFASAWLYGAEPALQDFEAASPDLAGDDSPGNFDAKP